MKPVSEYALDDLKFVYQYLHSQLPANPQLMDSEFLHDLQTYLQAQARAEGVDVSLHAQWASWLNDGALAKGL